MRKKSAVIISLILSAAVIFTACGSSKTEDTGAAQSASASADTSQEDSGSKVITAEDAPEFTGLTFDYATDFRYATEISIYNYEAGYSYAETADGDKYFIVPEDGEVPEDLDEDIVVLQKPLDNSYLAATSAMALFDAIGAVDTIKFTGTNANGWYVDAAVEARNSGEMKFAGKYSAPDYETLVDENCTLAIESTMIYHSPKVKEMLEDLGIPVFVDKSSYESHPLGRTEWIKFYGMLADRQDEASEYFDKQAKIVEDLEDFENTGKTVVFFNISTDGRAVIRNPKDYISKMIDIAGGKYAFADIQTAEKGSSMSISMEDFYTTAVDADYLIYNASIVEPITGIDDLIAKDSTFADYKAVKEGNVWTTGKSFYQRSDLVGDMINDFHEIINDTDKEELVFMTKVK